MLDPEALSFEPELVRPLKRSEYDQMVALGLFDDERVELSRGVLVKISISPQRAPHASTVQKLYQLLTTRLQNRFTVRSQLPIALSDTPARDPAPGAPGVARCRARVRAVRRAGTGAARWPRAGP